MAHLLKAIMSLLLSLFLVASPTFAARETNSYDGNIYFLYGANGSLVPPSSNLSKAIDQNRTSVIIYYLDDSADSKAFAPVVSALQLIWGPSIDIIPLTTDEMQGNISTSPQDESYYWRGVIPQVVVINGKGEVIMDKEGLVSLEVLNKSISEASGLDQPSYSIEIKSFNEYNSEPSKEGYTDPRGSRN